MSSLYDSIWSTSCEPAQISGSEDDFAVEEVVEVIDVEEIGAVDWVVVPSEPPPYYEETQSADTAKYLAAKLEGMPEDQVWFTLGCARPVSYTHLTLPTKRIV